MSAAATARERRRPTARARRAVVLAALWLGLAGAAPMWAQSAAQSPLVRADQAASPEALLVRGIAHSRGSALKLGLEELRLAARLRPDWRPAREALGVALLRAGSFAAAAEQFSLALGRSLADSLEAGRPSTVKSLGPGDRNALLGLAVSLQMDGRLRESERLYRTFADFVGTTSVDAARAYYRLHELFGEPDAGWGDQAAELSKALAVDPEVQSASLLPEFPDPAGIEGVGPYLVPIVLAEDQADTVDLDSLPALNQWAAPADSSSGAAELVSGSLPVEILVGADGVPEEVNLLDTSLGESARNAAEDAVMNWRFAPALARGQAVPAWIVYGRTQQSAGMPD